jgi:hypothetical protein
MFIHMTRIVKERVRYYNISVEKNLFDEYCQTNSKIGQSNLKKVTF